MKSACRTWGPLLCGSIFSPKISLGAEILGAAIDYFRQGQVSLRPLKVGKTVAGSAGKGG
jgi:hypothetical protein